MSRPVVIVAEDDPATRHLLSRTLEYEGFSVRPAGDGSEALAIYRAEPADVVLLDVEMPGLDGYAACERIRSDARGSRVPVVMVTSHDDRESIDRAYDVGATDFIAKPISWPLVGHRLRYILRGARNLQALGAMLEENRALMAAMPDVIFVLDRNGRILEHLCGGAATAGRDEASHRGRRIESVLPAPIRDEIRSSLEIVGITGRECVVEYESGVAAGAKRWLEARFVDHGGGRMLAIVRDISERKAAERRIHQLAFFDSLTDLPNRALFMDKLETALRGEQEVAVLAIDLDRFKRINDTLGTATGDACLIETGRRITDAIIGVCDNPASRVAETCVACLGGDEFAVMIAGPYRGSLPEELAAELRARIAEPQDIDGHDFVVTAGIGVARSPMHGTTADELVQNAEAARCEAKRLGSNAHKAYRDSMHAGASESLNLERELRRAIGSDGLSVHYQPKFRLRDGRLAGAEALLRWMHPARGEISPAVFVPVAEEAGLITELGAWVAERVCQQIAGWRYFGLDPGRIAINVSGQEFGRGRPAETLASAARRAGIEPAALELEITESVLMSDIQSVTRALHALREAGFSIAVDDFGTGYSSLQYLQRFPVDVLKIDASFVSRIDRDADSRAICSAIIALARSLQLAVVAEGVSGPLQRDFLRRQRCELAQGFLFSRPLSPADYAALLAEKGRHLASRANVARLAPATEA